MTKEQNSTINQILSQIKYSQIKHDRYNAIANSKNASESTRNHARLCSQLMDMVVKNRIANPKKK